MKCLCFVICLIQFHLVFAQRNDLGVFDFAADIGNPRIKGSSDYQPEKQEFQINAGGYNIWFNRDEFQFLYKKIAGNFLLTADFEFAGDGGDLHRKLGWMVRESTSESATSVNAVVHGDGLTVLQWRKLMGAYMRDPQDELFYAKKTHFRTIQLERSGKILTMRVANWGEPLQDVGSVEITEMKDSVLAGIFLCSHDSNRIEKARVWNVRIDKPAPEIYHPNPQIKPAGSQGVLGSRLELLDIADGKRTVILENSFRFEAPNWMPSSDKLLYNQGGALYEIPVTGGTPQKLNTGTATGLNNDHGITFDKKMLAISHSKPGAGGSVVSVLPLAGGEPKLVTDKSPSYWHGWSPDGKNVLVVGQRNNTKIFNLYSINITNGKETALTSNISGHVDGPEYSPDGKFIYYNANPTGTMQIWRMKPDGSAKEQLTFDAWHNWFPHISPDGKWMTMISFPTDIEPSSHPAYKKVMLRLMPVAGGAPKVIAHLYGGQGTINVNSWSPDSKMIAFVSNSEKK